MVNIFKSKGSGNVYLSRDEKGVSTGKGRFAWVHVVTKQPGKLDEKTGARWKDQFTIDFVFPKSDEAGEKFRKRIIEIKNEMVKLYNEDVKTKILVDDSDIFRDGNKSAEKQPLYADCWTFSAKSDEPIKVFDRHVKPIDAAVVKAGNVGKLVVRPKVHAKGLSYDVEIIQWIADDGVLFGGTKADSTDVLEAVGDDELDDNSKDFETYADAKGGLDLAHEGAEKSVVSKVSTRKSAIDAI